MISLMAAPAGGEGLPQNLEAEQAVLGSLLLDRDAVILVSQILRADDFALESHSIVYRVIVELYDQSRPVDYVTVAEEVQRRDLLGRAGGHGYLMSLVDVVPTALHVEYYAKIVQRLSILRRLIAAGGQIMSIAQRDGIEADEAISKSEEALLAVAQRRTSDGFLAVHDILAGILERLDYLSEHRGQVAGVPTGFQDMDKLLGGMQRSDLLILGARPAHGKTAFALGICHNAAVRYKQRIAVFSLEMSGDQLVQRLLCMQGRLDSGRLRSGYLDEDEWARLIEAAATLSETRIYIDDSAGVTASEMSSRCRRLQAEHGLDLIVVDYLQLMHLIGDGCTLPRHAIQYTTRERELAEMVSGLATAVFGQAVDPVISPERGWFQVYLRSSRPLTHGRRNPIAEWLDGLGVFGLRSHEKRVPDCVFSQPREGIARFLRHLWVTDGCIHLGAGRGAPPRTACRRSAASRAP